MIIPPFTTRGDHAAEFLCLAYVPIQHRQRRERVPASLGIYFCQNRNFTRFSRHTFDSTGRCLQYTRGDDDRDSLEFTQLIAHLDDGIHPAMWRLFPRDKVTPHSFTSAYETARTELCLSLFYFRSREHAAKLTDGMPGAEPLIIPDPSAIRLSIMDEVGDHDEMTNALNVREK